MERKRITISLGDRDLKNLQRVVELNAGNQTQAVQRSLAIMVDLLEHTQDGGEIFLQKGRKGQGSEEPEPCPLPEGPETF